MIQRIGILWVVLLSLPSFVGAAYADACVTGRIDDEVLENPSTLATFLSPFMGCLLPDMVATYEPQDGSFSIRQKKTEDIQHIYLVNLLQVLRSRDLDVRNGEIEYFFATLEDTQQKVGHAIDPDKIMPVLKPSDFIDGIRQQVGKNVEPLPSFPVADGLIQLFVNDDDNKVSYIMPDDLDTLKMDAVALRQKAEENLARYLRETPFKIEQAGPINVILIDDYYEASFAFYPSYWQQVVDENKANPVVLFLSRNMVAYTFDNDEEAVSFLRKISADTSDVAYPVTNNLYRWQDGKWSLYK